MTAGGGWIMGIGFKEILWILVIVLLLFGATRLPKVLGGLGKGIHQFKKGMKGEDVDGDDAPGPKA